MASRSLPLLFVAALLVASWGAFAGEPDDAPLEDEPEPIDTHSAGPVDEGRSQPGLGIIAILAGLALLGFALRRR